MNDPQEKLISVGGSYPAGGLNVLFRILYIYLRVRESL